MTDEKTPKKLLPSVRRRLLPSILIPGQASRRQKQAAQSMYERLVRAIIEFESALDEEHEVGAQLVSFDDKQTFNIMDIGFWDPDLIIFFGVTQANNRVQLMQHISQINIMLVAMPKVEKKSPPRRIGFILEQKMPKVKKGKKSPDRKTKSKDE